MIPVNPAFGALLVNTEAEDHQHLDPGNTGIRESNSLIPQDEFPVPLAIRFRLSMKYLGLILDGRHKVSKFFCKIPC
jgi:hypothetical protein